MGEQIDVSARAEEPVIQRYKRKFRRGLTILTTPRLLREQIEYMRHGPAPGPDSDGSSEAPQTERPGTGSSPPDVTPNPKPAPVFPASPWERLARTRSTDADTRDEGAGNALEPQPAARCNVCCWEGDAFDGPHHVEYQLCPACGSNGRDRFLFHCFTQRTPERLGLRIMETSPRMGLPYRDAMATWFRYVCSDFDASCHRAAVQLDLQQLGVRDATIDVLLTPHVLEHVPDTDRALAEIRRVLVPGGRMYLQVPVLQGRTAPPTKPEFHGDNTPVFWRFGFDFTARLRAAGFETTLLCLDDWQAVVAAGLPRWPDEVAPEFDVTSMLDGVVPDDLTVVLDRAGGDQLGLCHPYMFLVWECIRPD